MEKDIYEILQDWHKLLESGVISLEEFAAKKQELLKIDESEIKGDRVATQQSDNSTPFFSEIDDKENFILKYRLIGILLTLSIGIFGYYYYNMQNKEGNTSFEPTIGTYIINADETKLVHFHTDADGTTIPKAYFSTRDTVYISEIKNEFGYTEYVNSRNQKSKGWIRLNEMEFNK